MTSDDDNSPDRSKVERQIAKDLFDVFQKRQAALKAEHGISGGLDEEEAGLLKNLQTLELSYTGLAVSVATFWLCRGFRLQARKFAARRSQQSSGSGFSTDGGKTFSPFHNTPSVNSPPPPPPTLPPQSRLSIFFGLFIDACAGSLVGIAVDEYLSDRDGLRRQFVAHPLRPGRSGIADQFCPVMVEEYQNQKKKVVVSQSEDDTKPLFQEEGSLGTVTIQSKTNDSGACQDIFKNPQSQDLQTLLGFVGNCQKRQAMEQRIRQEKGLGPEDPVVIPASGVPVDEATGEDDESSFSTSSGGGDFYEQEAAWDTTKSNDDWTQEDVSSLVGDQEDSNSSRRR